MAKSIICIISIVLFCYACKKETGVEGPEGPIGNNGLNGSTLDTGTISGNLVVYDEFSWSMSDSSNVKVSLQSTDLIISASELSTVIFARIKIPIPFLMQVSADTMWIPRSENMFIPI